jgi:hypothetical protein
MLAGKASLRKMTTGQLARCALAVGLAGALMFRDTSATLICTPVNGWKSEEALQGTDYNGIMGQARYVP